MHSYTSEIFWKFSTKTVGPFYSVTFLNKSLVYLNDCMRMYDKPKITEESQQSCLIRASRIVATFHCYLILLWQDNPCVCVSSVSNQQIDKVTIIPLPFQPPPRPSTFLHPPPSSRLSITRPYWPFNSKWTLLSQQFTFFAAANHLRGSLMKQKFTSMGSNGCLCQLFQSFPLFLFFKVCWLSA